MQQPKTRAAEAPKAALKGARRAGVVKHHQSSEAEAADKDKETETEVALNSQTVAGELATATSHKVPGKSLARAEEPRKPPTASLLGSQVCPPPVALQSGRESQRDGSVYLDHHLLGMSSTGRLATTGRIDCPLSDADCELRAQSVTT